MRTILRGGVAALAISSILSASALAQDAPKVGDKAPNFTLKASDGKTYKLADFQGKKAVVVAWFPKAFTSGCTAECKSFREKGDVLKEFKDLAYFTASVDDAETNAKFAKSLDLDYPILSDPDRSVAKAYGVVSDDKGYAKRWTFYIDKSGIIRGIEKKVNTAQAAAQVADTVKGLGLAGD